MRRFVPAAHVVLVCLTVACTGGDTATTPSQEIDNVEAFARMYGAVRFFYPAESVTNVDWDRFAIHGVSQVRAARDRRALETVLEELFTPLGPGVEVSRQLKTRAAPDNAERHLMWRYVGPGFGANLRWYSGRREVGAPAQPAEIDLGSGLRARVPLSLSKSEARLDDRRRKGLDTLAAKLRALPVPGETPDLDTRLAGIVVAWNVFRHFYPYWNDIDVDWDSRLRPHLEAAHAASSRTAYRDALRALVHDTRDGHGAVIDKVVKQARAPLPILLGVIEDQVVVTASERPEIPAGTVIPEIDGAPAMERVSALSRLHAGSSQWRTFRALRELAIGPKGGALNLTIGDESSGTRQVSLPFEAAAPAAEKRPQAITELESQIWYVDLTRAEMKEIAPQLEKLAAAASVIFDLRGYPGDGGIGILRHLIDEPEKDRWMHRAKIAGPFGRVEGWASGGWDLHPKKPRLSGRIVFLADGRAISYAESVLGYVADRKLGTIFGGNTAGANGNVAVFDVPGGFRVAFTGMRVTRHDGRTTFHAVGMPPDVSVMPTFAGLRSGRDEVLERAIAAVK